MTANNCLFGTAQFMFRFITITLILSSMILLFGGTISFHLVIIAFLLSSLLLVGQKKSVFLCIQIVVLASIIFVFCILLSQAVFDYSWDGTAYHKAAVGLLKEGWNPIYQSSFAFNDARNSILEPSEFTLIWPEVYPKAIWYFQAALYSFTQAIESSKALAFIFIFITFGYAYHYFLLIGVGLWRSTVLAVLFSLNPIMFAQLNTFYVDGIATSIILLLMISAVMFFYERHPVNELYECIIFLILWGCNIKFSVTAFIALYCFILWILMIIFKKDRAVVQQTFLIFFVTAILSFCIVGASPYFTNMIRYGSLTGQDLNFMSLNTRIDVGAAFNGCSNATMLLISMFSKMGHLNITSISEALKFPFFINTDELQYYSLPNPYYGGWGMLWSSIFLISVLFQIYFVRTHKSALHQAYKVTLVLECITFAVLLFLPGTSEARYSGHLYFIPIVTFLMMLDSEKKHSIFRGLLAILMVLNILPWVWAQHLKCQESRDIANQLSYIAETGRDIDLEILNSNFHSLLFNIKDFDISFHLVPYNESDKTYKSFYNWQLYYKLH